MSATMTRTIRNGIDVTGLQNTIEAVRANPAAGLTSWEVNSNWLGGTRSDHVVDGCRIGGQDVERHFKLSTDEPLELLGTNEFANPQEYLMAGLNACMIVGYAALAALMGVRLSKIEIRTSGDIDLRAFLGIDSSVTTGYESLEQTVTLSGDATHEQLQRIHELVKRTSPNYYNITHAIALKSRLVVE